MEGPVQDPYYSFGKLLDYIGRTTIEPVKVEADGEVMEYPVPDKFLLSPLFFRGDDCYRSGRCCRPYDVSWTKGDWDRQVSTFTKEGRELGSLEGYQELKDTSFEHEILVNGTTQTLVIDPVTNKDHKRNLQCDQLRYNDDGVSYCAIREINSITCRMPHSTIRYIKRSNTTHFQKQQFGKNHHLQCPVKFTGFNYQNLIETDIPLLERLDQSAQDLGFQTIIPRLIDVIELMKPSLREGLLPKYPINISMEVSPEDTVKGIKWTEGEPTGFKHEPSYSAVFIPVPKVPKKKAPSEEG